MLLSRNTMTSGCKTIKTSGTTRHEEPMDHKHAVSARKLSANFEATVSKAFCEEDEAITKACCLIVLILNYLK